MKKSLYLLRNTVIAAAAAGLTVFIVHDQIARNAVSEKAAEEQEALQAAVYSGMSDEDIRILIDSLSKEQKKQILRAAGIDTDKIDMNKLENVLTYLQKEDYDGLSEYAENNLTGDDISAMKQLAEAISEQLENQ